jgi:cellulose synthase A
MEGNMEWTDRIEKWKLRQEKRGLLHKGDGGSDEENNDEEYML